MEDTAKVRDFAKYNVFASLILPLRRSPKASSDSERACLLPRPQLMLRCADDEPQPIKTLMYVFYKMVLLLQYCIRP
jgi:hypothetical protein